MDIETAFGNVNGKNIAIHTTKNGIKEIRIAVIESIKTLILNVKNSIVSFTNA